MCTIYCERISVNNLVSLELSCRYTPIKWQRWHLLNLSSLVVWTTRFWGKGWLSQSVNESMNCEAFCRTAPATLGLLNMRNAGNAIFKEGRKTPSDILSEWTTKFWLTIIAWNDKYDDLIVIRDFSQIMPVIFGGSGPPFLLCQWLSAIHWSPLHNCFGPPSLLLEGLLSTGPTPSSCYLLVEMGLQLHLFPAYTWCELDQLFIKRHHHKDLKWTKLYLGPI